MCFIDTGVRSRIGAETLICVVSGVGVGLLVASRLRTIESSRQMSFVVVGGSVAALAAALGCVFLGVGGILGVAAGVFLAIMPAFILVRAAA
jgi:hypothetical protein